LGSIQLAGKGISVRARRTRSERLRDAVTRAYAGKYTTKASEKWVRGFAEPHCAATTLEFGPALSSPVREPRHVQEGSGAVGLPISAGAHPAPYDAFRTKHVAGDVLAVSCSAST